MESLTPRPGIREQYRSLADNRTVWAKSVFEVILLDIIPLLDTNPLVSFIGRTLSFGTSSRRKKPAITEVRIFILKRADAE